MKRALIAAAAVGCLAIAWFLVARAPHTDTRHILACHDAIAVSYKDTWGVNQIVIVALDGDERAQLTHNNFDATFPAWSPDGERIAYVAKGDGEIRVVNADGSRDRALTDAASGTLYVTPRWSPDGSTIVYASGARVDPDPIAWPDLRIWRMRADGSEKTLLTSGNFGDFAPTWSPDGTYIAFSSNRSRDGYHIWRADADGANPMQMTFSGVDPATNYPIEQKMPMWSPDGKHIAYWSGVEMSHLDRRTLLRQQEPTTADLQIARTWYVWLMDADGGHQHKLTRGDNPAWSPDSSKILYPKSDQPMGVGIAGVDGSLSGFIETPGEPAGFSWRPVRSASERNRCVSAHRSPIGSPDGGSDL